MDLNSYNLYAYCSNNPVMHTDPSGHLIGIIAFFVGVCALAGGASAYNSAKESGVQGEERFWEPAKGAGKGAAVGAALSTLACVAGGTIATYGFTSVAGTAVTTATASALARGAEVGILQYQKSQQDGKSGWQIANDIVSSAYDNTGRILFPAMMKPVTTANGYIRYYRNFHISFRDYAYVYKPSIAAYGGVIYAFYNVCVAATSTDPVQRAYERGYLLK